MIQTNMKNRYEICTNCCDRYCCRGLCKQLNDYLIKNINKQNKKCAKLNKNKKAGQIEWEFQYF